MDARRDADRVTPPGLAATEFTPLSAPHGRRRWPFSGLHIALAIIGLAGLLVLIYLFTARAVIFTADPLEAEVEISGLSFNIGKNFLVLPGTHTVDATAEGYFPLTREIEISTEATQEIKLQLQALPGKLLVESELDDIEVLIDDEPAGTVPGLIEDLARGTHIIEFRKHRYFPLRQELEIEGLGRTQTLLAELLPAWGQMQFSSIPPAVEVLIDGELAGTTPLTTEVLETGSQVSMTAPGYKTWEAELTVKAGTEAAHPTVRLVVADGTLTINSSPKGASVTIDSEFRGTTPLSLALSPLKTHRVELYREGYQKAVRNVDIEPEQDHRLTVNLSPIIGRIRLEVSPADAEVVVDGQLQGTGGRTLSLTARTHSLVIRKAGFEPQSLSVVPRPDHDQALDIKLLTVQEAYWSTRPARIQSPLGSPMLLFRPNASFTLGAPRREPGRRANEAERSVQLQRPFYLATEEVTNEQFRRWREQHSSRAIQGNTLDMDDQPAVYVSWLDAAQFCNWLSRHAGLPPFYIEEQGLVTGFDFDSSGYRLPTEAEWAWAAKIHADGQVMTFPWGTELYPPAAVSGNYADQSAVKFLSFTLSNYNDGFAVSAPVRSFDANSKGLYDLDGNVSEWVNDYYDIRPSRGAPEIDPKGPENGNRHAIRGASWGMGSRSELRLSYRDAGLDGRMDLGFRIARYVDEPGASQ